MHETEIVCTPSSIANLKNSPKFAAEMARPHKGSVAEAALGYSVCLSAFSFQPKESSKIRGRYDGTPQK